MHPARRAQLRRYRWKYFREHYMLHPIKAVRCYFLHRNRPRPLALNEIWCCPSCDRVVADSITTDHYGPAMKRVY